MNSNEIGREKASIWLVLLSVLAVGVLPLNGADVIWDGDLLTGSESWSDDASWVGGAKPTIADNAFLNETSIAKWEPDVDTSENTQNLTLVARGLDITAELTVTANTYVSANLNLIGGNLVTGNLVLDDGSELTMTPASNLNLMGNITVRNSTTSANGDWNIVGNGQDLSFENTTIGSNLQVDAQLATAQLNMSGNLQVGKFYHASGNLEIGAGSNLVSVQNITLARTGGNLVVNSANLSTSSSSSLNDADLIVEGGSYFRLYNAAEVQVGYYLLQKSHDANITGGTLNSNVTVIGKIWDGRSANLTNEIPGTFLRWQDIADQRLATDNLIFAGNGYDPTIIPDLSSTASSEDITANDVVISMGNLNVNGNLNISNNFYSDANLNMTAGNMRITGGVYVEAYGGFNVDANSRVEVGQHIVIVASDDPANFQGNVILNGSSQQNLETETRLDLLTVNHSGGSSNVFLTGNAFAGTFVLGDGDILMDQGHNFVIDEGLTMGGGNFNVGSSNLYLYDTNLSVARDFNNTTTGNIYVSNGGNLKLNDFNLSTNTLFSATGRYTFDLHGSAPFNDNINWTIGQPDLILRDSGVTAFTNVIFSTIYSIDALGAGMTFNNSTIGVSENVSMASGTMTINESYVRVGIDLDSSNGNVLLNSGNLVIGNDLITSANSSVDFVAGNVSADNLTFDGSSFTYTDDVTFFGSENLLFDDVPGYDAWTTVSNIIISSSNVGTNATNINIGGYLQLTDTDMSATDIYLSGVSDNIWQTGNTVSAVNNIWISAGASYRLTNGNLTAGNIIVSSSTFFSDSGNITTSGNAGPTTSVNTISNDYDLRLTDSLGYFAGTSFVQGSVNLHSSNVFFNDNGTATFDNNLLVESSNIHFYTSSNLMVAENLTLFDGSLLRGVGNTFVIDVDQTLSFTESSAYITGTGSNVTALVITIGSNSYFTATAATDLLAEDDLTITGGNLVMYSNSRIEVVDDMDMSGFGFVDLNNTDLQVGGNATFIDGNMEQNTSNITVIGDLTYSSNTSLTSTGSTNINVTGDMVFNPDSAWDQTGLNTVNAGRFQLNHQDYNLGFSADFFTASNTTISAGNFHHTAGNAVVGNMLIEENGCFTHSGGDFRASLLDIYGGKLDIQTGTSTAQIADLSMDTSGAALYVRDDTTIQSFEMVGGDIYHYGGNLTIEGELFLSGNYIYLGDSGAGNLNVSGNLTVPAGAQFLPGPNGVYVVGGTTTINNDSIVVLPPAGAINWTGASSSFWADGTSWSSNPTAPTSSENVWIANSASLTNEPNVQTNQSIRSVYAVTSTLTITSELDVLENFDLYGASLDIGTTGILDVAGNVSVHLASSLGTLNNGNIQIGGNLFINNATGSLFNGKLTFDGVDQEVLVNGALLRDIVVDSSSSSGNVVLSDNLTTRSVEVLSGNLDTGMADLRIYNDTNIEDTLSIGGGNVWLLDTLNTNNRNLQIESGATLKITEGSNLVVNDLVLESGSTFIGEGTYGITILGSIRVFTNNWTSGMGNVIILGDSSDSTFTDVQFYDLSLMGDTDLVLSGTNLNIANNFRVNDSAQVEFQSTPLTVGGNLYNQNLLIFDGSEPNKIQSMDDTVGTLRFGSVSGGNIDISPVTGTRTKFDVYRFEVLEGAFVSSTNLSLGNLLITEAASSLTTQYIGFEIDSSWSTAGTLVVENGSIEMVGAADTLYPQSGSNLTLRNSSMTGFDYFYILSGELLLEDSDLDVSISSYIYFSQSEFNRGAVNTGFDFEIYGGDSLFRDYVLNISDDFRADSNADITHVGGQVRVGDELDIEETTWNLTASNLQVGGEFSSNLLTWVSSTDNVYFQSTGNLFDSTWTADSNLYFMDDSFTLGIVTQASSNAALSGGNLELVNGLTLTTSYFSYSGGNANFSSNIIGSSASSVAFYSTNVTVDSGIILTALSELASANTTARVDSGIVLTNFTDFDSANSTLTVTANVYLDNNSNWDSIHDTLTITDAIILDNSSDVGLSGNTGTLSVPNITSLDANSVFQSEEGPIITTQTGSITLSETSGSYIYNLNVPVGVTTTVVNDLTLRGDVNIYGNLDQSNQDLYLAGGNFYMGLVSTLSNPNALIVTGSSNYADGKGIPSSIGDLTIQAGATLLLLGDITIGGDLVNLGTFEILGWDVNDVGGTFDNNTGTIVLHGDTDFNIPTDPTDIIDMGTIQFVDGAPNAITLGINNPDSYKNLTLSGANTYYINDTVSISGTLQIDAAANIYIGAGKTLALDGTLPSFSADDIVNDGTLLFQNGATVTLNGGEDLGFVRLNDAGTVVTINDDATLDGLILGTDSSLVLTSGNLTVSANGLTIFNDATFTTSASTNVVFSGTTTYDSSGTTSIQNILIPTGSNLILLSGIDVINLTTIQNGGTLRTYEVTTDQAVTSGFLDNDGTVLSYNAATTFSTNAYTDAGLAQVVGTTGPYTIGSPWLSDFYNLVINQDWSTSSNVTITNGFSSNDNLQVTVGSGYTLNLTYPTLTVNDNFLLLSSSNLDASDTNVSLMSNIIMADQSMLSANQLIIEATGNLSSLARSTIRVAGDFNVLGNWSEGQSDFVWEGAGNFVAPNETFYDLSFDGTDFNFSEDITVSNALNLLSGNLTWGLVEASSGNLWVYSAGNFTLTTGNLQMGSNLRMDGIGNVTGNVFIGQDLSIDGEWTQPSGNLQVSSNVSVAGTGNVMGHVTIGQDLWVTGEWFQNSGNHQVSGNSTISGNISLESETMIGGNLNVSGEWIQTSSNLQVTGESSFAGNVSLEGEAVLGGNVSVAGEWVQTSGNFQASGNLEVSGSTNLVGYATISDDFVLSGTWTQTSGNLDVSGNAVVSGNSDLTGDAVVGGNFNVSGVWAQTSGNLQVSSNAMVTGNVTLSGESTFDGNLNVSGEWAQTSGNLVVMSDVTVDGTLQVADDANVDGELSVSGEWTQTSGDLQVDMDALITGMGNITGSTNIGGALSVSGNWSQTSGNLTIASNVTVTGQVDIAGVVSIADNLIMEGDWTQSSGNLQVGTNLMIDGVGYVTANVTVGQDITVAGDWTHNSGNLDLAGNVTIGAGNFTITDIDPDYSGNLEVYLTTTESVFSVADDLTLDLSIPLGTLEHTGGDIVISNPTGVSFGGNYTYLGGTGNIVVSNGNLTIEEGATFNLGSGGNLVLESGVEFYPLGDFIADPGSSVSLDTIQVSSGNLELGGSTALDSLVINGGNVSLGGNSTVDMSTITISSTGNFILEAGASVNLVNLTMSAGNIEIQSGAQLTLSGNLEMTGGAISVATDSTISFLSDSIFTSSQTPVQMGNLIVGSDNLTLNIDHLIVETLEIENSANLIQGANTLVVNSQLTIGTEGWLWNSGGNLDISAANLNLQASSNLLYTRAQDLTLMSGNVDGRLEVTSANLLLTGSLSSAPGANVSAMDLLPSSSTWNTSADLSFADLILTSSTLENGGGDVVLTGAIWIDASSNLQHDSGLFSVTGSVNVNGGIFDLGDSTVDLTSTDLIIDNDATVELSDHFGDNLVFLSGTLVQQSGNLTLNEDFLISTNVVINGSTTWNLPAGSNVTVESGGSLTIGENGDLTLSSGVDFILTGDLQAQAGAGMSLGNLILNVATVDLSNFSSLSIESVTVSNGTVTLASGNSSFTQVTVDSTGTLVFPSGANLTVTNGFAVDGTVNMQSGSLLVLQGGDLSSNGASMGNVVIAGSVRQLESSLRVNDLTVLSGGNYLMSTNTLDATGNVRVASGGNILASGAGLVYSINTEAHHQIDGGYELQGGKTLVDSLGVGTTGVYSSNTDVNGSATIFNGQMTDGYVLNIFNNSVLDVSGATTNPASNGLDIILGASATANLLSAGTLGDLTIGTDATFYATGALTVADNFENGGNLHLSSSNLSIATMDVDSGTVVFENGALGLGGSNSPDNFFNLEMSLSSSDEDVTMMGNITVNGDLTSTSATNTRLVSSGYDLSLLGNMIESNVASSSNLGVSGCVILGASGNLSGTIYAGRVFMTTPATQFGPLTETASLTIENELVINGSVAGNIILDFSAYGLSVNLGDSASSNLDLAEFNNVTFNPFVFGYNSRAVNTTNLATEFVQFVPSSGSNLQGTVNVDWTQVLSPGETFPTIRIYRANSDGTSTGTTLSGDIASGAGNTFAWDTTSLSDALGEIYLGAYSTDGSTRLSDSLIGPFTIDNHLNLQTPDATGVIPRFDGSTGVVTFNFDHIPDSVVPGLISVDGTYATNLESVVISPAVNGTTQPTLTLNDMGILAVSEASNFILSPGAFTWNGNTLFSTNTNVFSVVADTSEPTLVDWDLNLNTRQLVIEFNEPVSENGLSAANITLSYGTSNSHTLSTSSTIARDTVTAPTNLIVSIADADYLTLAGFVSSSSTVETWQMALSSAFVQNLYGESYITTGNTTGSFTGVTSAELASAISDGSVTGESVFTSIFDDTTLTTTETLDLATSLWATVDPTSTASLPTTQTYTTTDGETWFAAYNSTSNNSTLPVASTPKPSFTVSGIPDDAIFTALVTPLDASEMPSGVAVASDLLSFHLYDNDGSGNTYSGGSFSIDVRFMNLSDSGYPDAPEKYTMYSFDSTTGTSQASSHVISDGGDDAITVTFTSFSEYILVFDQAVSPFASGGGGGGGCLLRPSSKKEDQD